MTFKIATEKESVQKPLINYVKEIGWEYLSPEECERLRGGRTGLILKEIFSEQIQKLNSDFINEQMIKELVNRLEKLPANIEGNLQAWEHLKGIKTIFVPKEKRERNVTLIHRDFKKNVFHVTEEFSYTNGIKTNRFDVVFFINGIPVFFVETKAPHKIDGLSIALTQVERYHRETPEPMTLFQVYALTHIINFFYSSTWNFSLKTLFSWKIEDKAKDFESSVKDFFDRKKSVEIILDYILFTRKDDLLQKVILRPHQIRAINKILERAASKTKKRGLIWHTQGSGKTYTMIVSAKKILENPLFENPTVILLVDRNELESQLFGNLSSLGFEKVQIAESKRHLQNLLRQDTRGLIVSMIHKFEGMPKNINTRDNIFVFIDEAHRTTGGKLGNYLMGALPNATYIGFTGTPIDKTAHGKGTFIIFGRDDPPHGYLDKYRILESIEDGTTVKLRYSVAPNDLLPDKETLEREFLKLKETEGISDIESLNKILEKAVNLKNMLKNKERIRKIAKYVAEHYKNFVEPLGYKAFLVAVDREACAMYKEQLDKFLPKEYSKVVISSAQNDPEELKKYYLSETEEKQVRKNFVNPHKLPKILIVTEKLLTGFDAPVLYSMYLDKPMRDHVLLQAIARVNRPYEDKTGRKKPCGLVVDFIGIFHRLKEALAFDSRDIEGIIEDIEILKDRFKKLIKEEGRVYLSIIKNKRKDKIIDTILEYFRDREVREKFFIFYKELSSLYDILSPDPFLRDYLEEYDTLSRMFKILKEAFEPSLIIEREFSKKTAKLVQEYTKTSKIQGGLEIYEIDENTLKKIEQIKISDTRKVFNLIKSIENIVSNKKEIEPYLIQIGERAEMISERFRQGQIETKETLETLKKIIEEINLAEKEKRKKKMPPHIFFIYWFLKNHKIDIAEKIANDSISLFEEFPHWRIHPEQERELKKKFYNILIKNKLSLKEAVGLGSEILKILKRIKNDNS